MASFAMLSRIRLHLDAQLAGRIWGGGGQILQIDETWVGQVKNSKSPSGSGVNVFGIHSKSGVITKVIPNRSSNVLIPESNYPAPTSYQAVTGNYPAPTSYQAVTAPRMVWNGVDPARRAVSTVVRKAASASAAHLAR